MRVRAWSGRPATHALFSEGTPRSHDQRGLVHGAMAGRQIPQVPAIDDPLCRVVGSADHTPNHRGGHFDDFRSYHMVGANFAFADGSTRFFSETTDKNVARNIVTIADGATLPVE